MEIFTMTTILMASMNLSNANPSFAYNAEMEGDVITAQTVYRKSDDGKYLSQHLRYNFVYDEDGRLARKEVLKWDEWKQEWIKSHSLNYLYDVMGYSIDYALWDEEENQYAEAVARQTYTEGMAGTVEMALYKWDDDESTWVVQERNLMMSTQAEYLASTELSL